MAAPADDFIRQTLSSMSTAEKARLLAGADHWLTHADADRGVDELMLCDGPHGLRKQVGAADHLGLNESVPAVCYPTAATMACSFDPDLAEEVGRAIGDEAVEQNVAMVLGPGMNIKRSPLGGRGFEYFSEDPCLSGKMAAGMVRGIQGKGVGACVKHFACNSQEIARMVSNSVVDDRALNEIYLRGFEIAVRESQPWAIMTAYNLLNGVYCSENPFLLQDKLRDEWGFEGLCVTDWGAMSESVPTVAAGCDLVMPGPRPDHEQAIVEAVKSGELTEEALDRCAGRIIDFSRKRRASAGKRTVKLTGEERLDVARRAAEQCAVLLENDGTLPIAAHACVAVIGAFATIPRYQGAGSSKINPVKLDDFWSALCNAGVDARYAAGYDAATGDTDEEKLAEAEAAARQADVAVVLAGLPDWFESEGFDRSNINMPQGHLDLIERVCCANPRTVLVIQGGSPVAFPWLSLVESQHAHAPAAVLLAGLAGCMGGSALANIITGVVNPSGKLAETWPVRLEDTALGTTFPDKRRNVLYRESIFVGYRWFDAASIAPAYPFGHGLSYVSFAYDNLSVTISDGVLRATFDIANSGDRAGAEAAQVYVAPIDAPCIHAPQALAGFAKIMLDPGETARLAVELDARSFGRWDADADAWLMDAGAFEVRVGSSSRDIRLKQTVVIDRANAPLALSESASAAVNDRETLSSYYDVTRAGFTDESFAVLFGRPLPPEKPLRPIDINSTVADIDQTFLGHLVFKVIEREARKTTKNDAGDTKAILDAMMADMPLRSLTMGGAPMSLVHALVDLLNGRYLASSREIIRVLKLTIKALKDKGK